MTNTTDVNLEQVQKSPILSAPELIINEPPVIQSKLWSDEEIEISGKKVNELFDTSITELFNSAAKGDLSRLKNALEGGLYKWLKDNNQILIELQKNIKEQIDLYSHQLHKTLPQRYSNEWVLSILETIATKCKSYESNNNIKNKPILNWSKTYANKNTLKITLEEVKKILDYSKLSLENDEQIKKCIKEHLEKSDNYFGENEPIKNLNKKDILTLVTEHVFQKVNESLNNDVIWKQKEKQLIIYIEDFKKAVNPIQDEKWIAIKKYLKELSVEGEHVFDIYNKEMQQKSTALQFLEDQITYVNVLLELKEKLDFSANDAEYQAKVIMNECVLKQKCDTLLSYAYKHGAGSDIFNYLLEQSSCLSLATFCIDKENFTFLHKALSAYDQPALYELIFSYIKRIKPLTEEETKIQQAYLKTMQSLWSAWEDISISKKFP